jgi:hypothetical protein
MKDVLDSVSYEKTIKNKKTVGRTKSAEVTKMSSGYSDESSSSGGSSDYFPPISRSSGGGSTRRSAPAASAAPPIPQPADDQGQVAGGYDASLPIMVALGCGLTPSRIVKKLSEEMKEYSLKEVVKYMISPEVATEPSERAIVEGIEQRMGRPDYRIIVNRVIGWTVQPYNLHNSRLDTDKLGQYLHPKDEQFDDTTITLNYADLAIVSREEGGLLEKLVDLYAK